MQCRTIWTCAGYVHTEPAPPPASRNRFYNMRKPCNYHYQNAYTYIGIPLNTCARTYLGINTFCYVILYGCVQRVGTQVYYNIYVYTHLTHHLDE